MTKRRLILFNAMHNSRSCVCTNLLHLLTPQPKIILREALRVLDQINFKPTQLEVSSTVRWLTQVQETTSTIDKLPS